MKVIIFVVCAVISVTFVSGIAVPVEYQYNRPEQGTLNTNGFQPIDTNGKACTQHGSNNRELLNAASVIQKESSGRILNYNNNQDHSLVAAASGISSNTRDVTLNSQIVVDGTGQANSFTNINHNNAGSFFNELPFQNPPPVFAPNKLQREHVVHIQTPYRYQPPVGGKIPAIPSQLFASNNFGFASTFSGNKFEGSRQQIPIFHKTVAPLPYPQGVPIFSNSQFGQNGHASSINQQYIGSSFSNGFNSAATSSNIAGQNILNGHLGTVIHETFNKVPLDPTVEKHIYVHVPPEDLESQKQQPTVHIPQVHPKKHYKIIFIKAPSQDTQVNYAQLAAAQNQNEEKTIVYVLVKKPDVPNFQEIQQIQQSINKHNKPEVYFIKYKTRKEGEQASESLINSVGAHIEQHINAGQQISNNNGYQYHQNAPIVPIGYSSKTESDIPAGDEGIDIRSDGVGTIKEISSSASSAVSTSSSSVSGISSASSSIPSIDDRKHGLYGVPLN